MSSQTAFQDGAKFIAKLLQDPTGFAEAGMSNDLLRCFFHGLPIERLQELMRHSDEKVLACAIWIAAELGNRAKPLLDEAIRLSSHNDRYVRFYALEVIAQGSVSNRAQAYSLVVNALEDRDIVVRRKAMTLLTTATEHQLSAVLEWLRTEAPDSIRTDLVRTIMELTSTSLEEVCRLLAHDDVLHKRVGAVIAERLYEHEGQLLRIAHQSDDPEISEFAQRMLELHETRNP